MWPWSLTTDQLLGALRQELAMARSRLQQKKGAIPAAARLITNAAQNGSPTNMLTHLENIAQLEGCIDAVQKYIGHIEVLLQNCASLLDGSVALSDGVKESLNICWGMVNRATHTEELLKRLKQLPRSHRQFVDVDVTSMAAMYKGAVPAPEKVVGVALAFGQQKGIPRQCFEKAFMSDIRYKEAWMKAAPNAPSPPVSFPGTPVSPPPLCQRAPMHPQMSNPCLLIPPSSEIPGKPYY